MKALMGLLAIGILCLIVPRAAHAHVLNCVRTSAMPNHYWVYECEETQHYADSYFWEAPTPGSAVYQFSDGHVDRSLLPDPTVIVDYKAFYFCAYDDAPPDSFTRYEPVKVTMPEGAAGAGVTD